VILPKTLPHRIAAPVNFELNGSAFSLDVIDSPESLTKKRV
jgi:hypothetical protein